MKALLLTALITGTLSAQEPAKLTEYRKHYKKAVSKVVKPIDLKYIKLLQKLQTDLAAKGKLKEALTVKEELDKFKLKYATKSATPVKIKAPELSVNNLKGIYYWGAAGTNQDEYFFEVQRRGTVIIGKKGKKVRRALTLDKKTKTFYLDLGNGPEEFEIDSKDKTFTLRAVGGQHDGKVVRAGIIVK